MVRKAVIANPREAQALADDKEALAGKFIQAGGTDPKKDKDNDVTAMTLRIPTWVAKKIDKQRRKGVAQVSRNTWILMAIEDKLESDGAI
jgi:hypothetical protein